MHGTQRSFRPMVLPGLGMDFVAVIIKGGNQVIHQTNKQFVLKASLRKADMSIFTGGSSTSVRTLYAARGHIIQHKRHSREHSRIRHLSVRQC